MYKKIGKKTSLKKRKKATGGPSLKNLEKYAWTEFSKFIRLRDCLKTTGAEDYGLCFTCGARKHFKELDAGHFVKSTHKEIKFDERNVNAQCQKCNRFNGGEEAEYLVRLEFSLGRDVVDYLMSQKGKSRTFTRDELVEIREKYKNKQEKLKA